MSEKLITRPAAVCVGTCDWEWPDWTSSYYPDDLPGDWRASYYANDARCVCLPQRRWLGASDDQLADWCDDLPDEFRFYLAVDEFRGVDGSGKGGPALSSALSARLDALGRQCAAILCAGSAQAALLSGALGERPLEILAPAEASIRKLPGQASIPRLWRRVAPDRSSWVACVEIDAGQPRAWRELLTALAPDCGGADSAAIFLSGSGVTPAVAREFRLVAELMGLA